MLRLAAAALALTPLSAIAAPTVVTDIAPVQALVARVMEGVAEAPVAIVPPGADPHALALKPSQARTLQNADLVFWIGEELTPWLHGPLETLAADAEHIALLDAEGTVQLEVREGLGGHGHDEHEEHSEGEHDDHKHEHGHDHGEKHEGEDHDDHAAEDDRHHHAHEGVDPHAWLDPANGAAWLGVIASALADADPENAEGYRDNATAGIAEINKANARIEVALAALKGVPFGVTHDAFQYFERPLGLAPVAAISDFNAAEPGPARVAAVQGAMRDANVVCLFEEAAEADPLSATVTEGTDAKIIALDQFGDGTSYVAMLEGLAASYASCLE